MQVRIDALTGYDTRAVLADLLDRHDEFWGGRDLRALHSTAWLHQFAPWGLLARDGERTVGYLLGTVTADGIGYVQLIAVLPGYRRQGIAVALWLRFAQRAAAAGATRLEAITGTANAASIAFHTGLGMSAEEIPDYDGRGQARVLFQAPIHALVPDSAPQS